MKCPFCGAEIAENSTFCEMCGKALTETVAAEAATAAVETAVPVVPAETAVDASGVSQWQFYKNFVDDKIRREIRSCGIFAYICAGLTLIVGMMSNGVAALIDVAILVGLGLGVHLKQSRVCAILLAAYGLFNVVYMLIETQQLSGWLIPLIGIYAVINTFKFNKAWKEFKK